MRHTKSLLTAAALFFTPACSGGLSGTVTDAEVDAIKTARESLTIASELDPTAVPDTVHVRLAWGYLAWKDHAHGTKDARGTAPTGSTEGFDWTGGLSLSDGTATLDMSTFLEPGDSAAAGAENEVKWISHTYPHFDGVIATLKPASASSQLVIDTPSFKQTFTVAELLAAGEQRFTVEATGREFSISPLPEQDAACSGFVVGFLRPDGDVTHFKGLRLSKLGDRLGKLRFDVTAGAIKAEVVDEAGIVVDSGEGTLDAAAKTFSITLGTGTVSGSYSDPSYSTRGAFQATARCP